MLMAKRSSIFDAPQSRRRSIKIDAASADLAEFFSFFFFASAPVEGLPSFTEFFFVVKRPATVTVSELIDPL